MRVSLCKNGNRVDRFVLDRVLKACDYLGAETIFVILRSFFDQVTNANPFNGWMRLKKRNEMLGKPTATDNRYPNLMFCMSHFFLQN